MNGLGSGAYSGGGGLDALQGTQNIGNLNSMGPSAGTDAGMSGLGSGAFSGGGGATVGSLMGGAGGGGMGMGATQGVISGIQGLGSAIGKMFQPGQLNVSALQPPKMPTITFTAPYVS